MGKEPSCSECGAALVAGTSVRRMRVGRYRVEEPGPRSTCLHGHESIDLETLAEYERRAAAIVLRDLGREAGGEEIRFARKAVGMTQARLAGVLDVAPETISRWENDAEVMSRVSRLALLAVVTEGERLG
jgi:DNA-binding transcriptional regulator YiaG